MTFSGVNKALPILTLIWLAFPFCITAQETAALSLLPGTSQSTLFNPAFQNKSDKLVIGIPVLSGVYGNGNMNVPINSLFSNGFKYDLHRFYDALGEQGKIQASAGVSMFFASMKYNDYTFSLSVSERAFLKGSFDREIVRIIRDGTRKFYGSDEYLGTASFYLQHFRQLAPGISKQIWEKMDIGFRAKILFGKLYFDAKDLNVSVETDPANNTLLVKPEGSFKMAGPFRHIRDTIFHFSTFSANISPGDYFFQPRNLGLAFDAGIIFRPDKLTELSLSILDIGFIGFKYNSFDIDLTRSIRYSEYSLYQSHNREAANYVEPREAIKDIGDSISYIMKVMDASERNIAYLPFKMNVTAKYRLSEKLSSGMASLLMYHNNYMSNMLSVFAYTNPVNKIELAGSLSIYNLTSIMPGLGISYTGNKAQFFFSSNNILGIIKPTASKHLNLYFGMNFLFETQ